VSAGVRLFSFGLTLAALLVAGFAAGRLLDASAPGASAAPQDHGEMAMDPVRGLGVAESGLRLLIADPELARGAGERLRFEVVDADGEAVTEFDRTHTRRMHAIVVRRDLTGFQHLHPALAADGTWAVPLRLGEPGTYRLFADFSHAGEATTLAGDLRVDGSADLRALPPEAERAIAVPGDFEVMLHARAPVAGEEAELAFSVRADGRSLALQRYLGAGGHLVALREGDLAFIHVHPTGDGGGDGSIEFGATFPTAGRYRLFLQFKVDGVVRTVAFTEEVG